jgi:hypothetical protein
VVYRTFVAGLFTAVLAFGAGCAGPTSRIPVTSPVNLAEVSELAGGWSGDFGWVGAYFYEAEGRVKLQIHEDGTFTGMITPNGGTNNLTKAAPLKGTVIADDNRVVLQNTEGPWTTLTLERWGDDTLYAPAFDPASQANVMLKLERDVTQG